jgi:septum formation inhibitor MinC
MAAAQATGTPAAAPAAPAAVELSSNDAIGLDAALAAIEAPVEDAPEAEAEEAPPAAPAKAPEAPAVADPFSAEALAAPGGIERAQAALNEKRKDHDRLYLKLSSREKKLNHDAERFKAELGQSRAFVQSVQADVRMLAEGTAEQKLEAIGRLTNKDPLKVWEEIAVTAASGGKKAPSAEVLELTRKLERFEQEREAERARAVEYQQVQQLNQLRGQMLQGAQSATEQFPALAHFASVKPAEVVEYLNDMIVAAHNGGQPMTWAQAYEQLNSELAPHHIPTAPAVLGLATQAAPVAAKPVVPTQRSPGRSLNPSLATRPQGSVREMTEQERIAELASDPDFLGSLF